MAIPCGNLVNQIRGLLDRLAASRGLDNDDQEVVADEVAAQARALPREGVVEALDKAIGSSRRRRQEAVYVLSELSDVAEAVERVGEWLKDPNEKTRSWLIQTVEHRRLKQFAPLLNDIIEYDPDTGCRTLAIHAAGALKQRENLPVLLRLAERNDQTLIGSLSWALKDYATEECQPHLQRWFEDGTQRNPTRVISAWGLGKLGDEKAITYLARMLEDPDHRGPTFFAAGQSIRAAQALCDIYGWPFEWHKSYVAKTAKLFKESSPKSLHSTPR
jgi:HEAT repeat protein